MDKLFDRYARVIAKKIRDDECAIFAGAGFSASVGFVNWAKLLQPFAEELGLCVKKESANLVRLAQFSVNERCGNRHHLNHALVNSFPLLTKPSRNHEILASMPISTYWTTNYDVLIETSLRQARKVADVKWQDSHLPTSPSRRDAVVYKMHGDVGTPDEAVLTRDDYEKYALKRPGLINALLGDLTVKTFLFIGFSFSDPNLDHVLSIIRQRYATSQREHFCLLRKVNRKDCDDDAEFVYDQARQDLFVKDLRRFNITAILVDEFAQITEFLELVDKYYRRDAVFVSGSIADCGPWGEDAVNKFVASIGSFLVGRKGKVVSGLGVGVGNTLVAGAVERAYADGIAHLNSFLEVRPFPQTVSAGVDKTKLWHAYRLELLRSAGIALFIFGNKKNDKGDIVVADGMHKEFDLAVENGLLVVPVGGTGWVAAELAVRVLRDFDKFYLPDDDTSRQLLDKLNVKKADLDDYLADLCSLLDHLMVK